MPKKAMLSFIFKLIFGWEVNDMAVVYATLIIKGKKTFAQVPDRLKEQVKEVLIDLDCEHLITDEK